MQIVQCGLARSVFPFTRGGCESRRRDGRRHDAQVRFGPGTDDGALATGGNGVARAGAQRGVVTDRRWVETFVVIGLVGGHPSAVELAALQWVSDHVGEFGARRDRMLVAGGARAARLALAARDVGWPAVGGQLLVHPVWARSGRCRRTSRARRPRPWCAGHAATAAAGTRSGCAPPGSRFARCGMTASADGHPRERVPSRRAHLVLPAHARLLG